MGKFDGIGRGAFAPKNISVDLQLEFVGLLKVSETTRIVVEHVTVNATVGNA
jgi:hypothetical protein